MLLASVGFICRSVKNCVDDNMITVLAYQFIAQTCAKSIYGAPVSKDMAMLPCSPGTECIVVYKAFV